MSPETTDGSEADAPTVVKAPGNADAPVVPNTLALTRKPLAPTSATDCCWPEDRGGAIVADEDVAGRVERDAGDPRERRRDHSLLERHEARTKPPAAPIAARPGVRGCEAMALEAPLVSAP